MNRRFALSLTVAVLAFGLGGCIEDENVVLPDNSPAQQLFRRYVSMGNSLTAGYMSGGINDSTQHLAYPVLLAEMAGMSFSVPSLVMPGCPPPLTGVVDEDAEGNVIIENDRVGGGSATSCSLRDPDAPQFVQNVAVPGSKMADAINLIREGNSTNTLTTLILGGLSQVEAMRRAQPTLVTSWLGNNDVLGGAIMGDTSLLTSIDTFTFYEERVAASIGNSGALGVALIGVLDVTLAPVLQPGLYYWLADSLGFAPKDVSANCGPTDAVTGEPNPLSMNTVSWRAFADTAIDIVSCDPSAEYVLTSAERDVVDERVDAFNNVLRIEAQNRNWVFIDATLVLSEQLTGGAQHNRLRRCVGLNNTLAPDVMVTFFEQRCPHPNAPNYFGSLVTFDGVHMSAAAHEVLADAIAEALESKYDVEL